MTEVDQSGLVTSPELVATRPWSRRLVGVITAALAVFLALYFPEREDGSGAILGGIFAFAAVALGVAAIERARPLASRSGMEQIRLLTVSIMAGAMLGVANLVANRAIALLDVSIYQQMTEEWATYSPWSMIIAGPLVEEIAFRLVLMGGLGWLLIRFIDNRRTVFIVVLAVSSLLFGLAHTVASSRPVVDALHGAGVALKSGAAGVVLGWIFWRWGLPYSVACHSIANAAHLLAAPLLFRRSHAAKMFRARAHGRAWKERFTRP